MSTSPPPGGGGGATSPMGPPAPLPAALALNVSFSFPPPADGRAGVTEPDTVVGIEAAPWASSSKVCHSGPRLAVSTRNFANASF